MTSDEPNLLFLNKTVQPKKESKERNRTFTDGRAIQECTRGETPVRGGPQRGTGLKEKNIPVV